MNRRGFLQQISLFVAAVSLPIEVISYDPVKQEVCKPKTDDSMLVGYKGNKFFEAGYIYAPYIPLYRTNEIANHRS